MMLRDFWTSGVCHGEAGRNDVTTFVSILRRAGAAKIAAGSVGRCVGGIILARLFEYFWGNAKSICLPGTRDLKEKLLVIMNKALSCFSYFSIDEKWDKNLGRIHFLTLFASKEQE